MNYIKALFKNSTSPYVFKTEDEVQILDKVKNIKGAKLTVTEINVVPSTLFDIAEVWKVEE